MQSAEHAYGELLTDTGGRGPQSAVPPVYVTPDRVTRPSSCSRPRKDFDVSVRHIVAQPFLLKAEVGRVVRRHIPDYLLAADAGPLVVDVKPRHRATRQENVFTFAWTRQAVESRGWRYEVWSEPSPVGLENVRFLAGYRRDWLFDHELIAELLSNGVAAPCD